MLPVVALVRARGGAVARVGVGSRGFARVPRALIRPSIALSNLSLWRDASTTGYLGTGETMPDLGFGEGGAPAGATEAAAHEATSRRDVLVVSLRSDLGYRADPSEEWLSGVREFARRQGLEIWTATQVHVDDERSIRLAKALGGQALGWDGGAHGEQEARLRELYQRAAVVVSDRLHVLIAALTEGAVPAGLLLDSSDKIERHFAAAGIHDVSVASAAMTESQIVEWLERTVSRGPELLDQLAEARTQLADAKARLAKVLEDPSGTGKTAARPYTAYQVGRHGEVAGGMTQVVNGYLAGRFEGFEVQAISSRDGSRGPRAVWLAISAGLRLIRLRDRGRSVVVVHLSERGSFVREGALLLLASARGLATVAHLHGSEFARFTDAHPRLVSQVLRAADLVLTLSEESSGVARRFVPADAVRLIPNAVAAGSPRPKEQLVVFGGAVTRRKGVDVLLAAWRELDERHPGHGWRLVVAGPIVDSDVVTEMLGRNGSGASDSNPGPANVEFLGAVGHAALMEMLERSAIAVLPSRDEAMPMFVLEAMARSNAVVSTTVGGIPAVLADGAGVLVPPGDVEQLAGALESLITDAARRGEVAQQGFAAFERTYSAAAVFPRVEEAWKAALDRRSRRALRGKARRGSGRSQQRRGSVVQQLVDAIHSVRRSIRREPNG
jgi:glycosyltransferase involved in cell wall biosynthesis